MPGILIVQPEERDWIHIWGPRCGIVEKRFLTKAHDFPLTAALRSFPKGRNLLSDSYQAHAHPSLELYFVLSGRLKMQVEGAGEVVLRPQQLVVMPPGVRHAATEAVEDSLAYVTYCPPYDKPIGPANGEAMPAAEEGFLIVDAAETALVYPWGPQGTVTEKRMLTREDGYGIGFTLRYVPGVKELAAQGLVDLHSSEGYTFHGHPCLEAGYVATGHFKGDLYGEADVRGNVFMAVPAHEKHGAKTPGELSIIAVVNYPPFGREPVITVRDGIPEEG